VMGWSIRMTCIEGQRCGVNGGQIDSLLNWEPMK